MQELEISINNSTGEPEKEFRSILGDFEEQHGAKISCTVFDWGGTWAEMMKIVLYKHGPVMSQVGSTWLGSLEATEGIRAFTPGEVNLLGGASAYHPAAWQAGISTETGRVMAIPWFLDTYALYYRKDLLHKAGVDEARAFESLDSLIETVRKLFEAGVTIPFAWPTAVSSRASLHNIAGWVWTYGGEFITADGRQLLLSDPKTRQGLKAYFSLHKSTPKPAQALSDDDCYAAFHSGRAALALRNSALLYNIQYHRDFADQQDNLGVAAMPGVNFIGGSNFVLWNHIRINEERLAVELLKVITAPETQLKFFQQAGVLPARIEALEELETLPLYAPLVKALMTGRAFRKFKLWGLVEERLTAAVGQIWQALYANENADIDVEIAKVLDPLERRLQITLSST